MKTRKEWNRSNKNLTEFLSIGDEIDESLYNYLADVTMFAYCGYGFVQTGEASFHREDTAFHMTACCKNGRYYYLGELPLFKY